ncbi:MAG: GLUG motif-containing protein [Bacillota bacterium]
MERRRRLGTLRFFNDDENDVHFTGIFDGNNMTISGLFINQPDTDSVGLFGYMDSGAKILNMKLADVNVTGRNFVGGLVGVNSGGTITNSHVEGAVAGSENSEVIGGLVGWQYLGIISDFHTAGTVTGL